MWLAWTFLFTFTISKTIHSCHGFVIPRHVNKGQGMSSLSLTQLSALSERQMQFWEDVEKGLDDIEKFYDKKGQDIHRVRQFGKSARGEIDPPRGSVPGHEPSEEHISGLTAQKFWNVTNQPDLFPWAKKLEDNAHIILQEFDDSILQSKSNVFAADSAWQNSVMGTGWSAIRLQRLGVWNMETCKQFPKTYELLRSLSIPFAVRGVCFARQLPNSGVQPHSDGRNFILTSHLGLQIPSSKCWIEVGGERRSWEVGKLTTLDTSFTHCTGNPTNEDRHVLIIDFWHPELCEAEVSALEFIYDLRNKYESGVIPYRTPKALVNDKQKKEEQEEGQGIGGLIQGLFGGKK